MEYKTPSLSFSRSRESMDPRIRKDDNAKNSIRVIREVGEGPDCKTGGCRAEVWSEDFSAEKYL